MSLSKQEIRCTWECDKKKDRKRFIIAWVAIVVIFFICLSIRYDSGFYPDQNCFVLFQNIKMLLNAAKIGLGQLFGSISDAEALSMIDALGSGPYYEAVASLKVAVMSFVAGGALALAGAIFQTIYRNPMASPNIIGASAGVRLGNALVVMMFSYQAYTMIYLRYAYCYGLTAICVGLILVFGKLTGDKKSNYSIMHMVMAGSIVSQVIQVFAMYIMYNLEDDDLLVYEQISLGTNLDTDSLSMIIFFGVMAISIIPMLLVKYRMNSVGMAQDEASSLGINVKPLRAVGQICGALMVTCAMIHFGEAGMVTMVIPYMCRDMFGSDFRKLAFFSFLVGAGLMMVCRLVSMMIVIVDEELPATFIMNIILMPIFLVILARQSKKRAID